MARPEKEHQPKMDIGLSWLHKKSRGFEAACRAFFKRHLDQEDHKDFDDSYDYHCMQDFCKAQPRDRRRRSNVPGCVILQAVANEDFKLKAPGREPDRRE